MVHICFTLAIKILADVVACPGKPLPVRPAVHVRIPGGARQYSQSGVVCTKLPDTPASVLLHRLLPELPVPWLRQPGTQAGRLAPGQGLPQADKVFNLQVTQYVGYKSTFPGMERLVVYKTLTPFACCPSTYSMRSCECSLCEVWR